MSPSKVRILWEKRMNEPLPKSKHISLAGPPWLSNSAKAHGTAQSRESKLVGVHF